MTGPAAYRRFDDPARSTFRPDHIFDDQHVTRTFTIRRAAAACRIPVDAIRRGQDTTAMLETVIEQVARQIAEQINRDLCDPVGPAEVTIEIRAERKALPRDAGLSPAELDRANAAGIDRVIVRMPRPAGHR